MKDLDHDRITATISSRQAAASAHSSIALLDRGHASSFDVILDAGLRDMPVHGTVAQFLEILSSLQLTADGHTLRESSKIMIPSQITP